MLEKLRKFYQSIKKTNQHHRRVTRANKTITEPEINTRIGTKCITAKKVIISIPENESLILERVYIKTDPVNIGGYVFTVIESNNNSSGKYQKQCINPSSIVLIEL